MNIRLAFIRYLFAQLTFNDGNASQSYTRCLTFCTVTTQWIVFYYEEVSCLLCRCYVSRLSVCRVWLLVSYLLLRLSYLILQYVTRDVITTVRAFILRNWFSSFLQFHRARSDSSLILVKKSNCKIATNRHESRHRQLK